MVLAIILLVFFLAITKAAARDQMIMACAFVGIGAVQIIFRKYISAGLSEHQRAFPTSPWSSYFASPECSYRFTIVAGSAEIVWGGLLLLRVFTSRQ